MRVLATLLVPGLLAAADLSTVLEIGISEGAAPLTYAWSVLAMPADAPSPRFEVLPIEAGPATNRVRAELPAARPGRYRFQVQVRRGEEVVHRDEVDVEVQSAAPSPLAQVQAASGCASGSALVLAGALAFLGCRAGRRRS